MTGDQRPSDLTKPLNETLDIELALQAAGLGVWEVNPITNQVQWDERCSQLFGIYSRSFVFQDTLAFIHPDDRERVNQAVQWALNPESDGNYQLTYRTIGEDGRIRWIQSTGRRYMDQTGQPVRFAGVAQEVTGQLEAQQREAAVHQLAQRQQRIYEAITASTPDLMYVFDLNYRFTYANQALLAMWGKSWEQSIGKTLLENGYEPWHAQMHEQEIDQVVATKQPIRGEVSFPHATLAKRIYDYVFAPVLNDQGEVTAVAGTTRDITDIRQAQALMEQSELFSRSIIEHSPVAKVVLVGQDMVIARINENMLQLLGRDGAILGKPFMDALPELRATSLLERLRQVLATGESYTQPEEKIDLVRFGQPYTGYYQYIYKVLTQPNGERYGVMVTATEVTQQVMARQQLEAMQANLQGAIELAQLGTWELDVATGQVHYSDTIKTWFGFEQPSVAYEQAFNPIHPQDQERVATAIQQALEPGSTGIYDAEYRLVAYVTGVERIIHARGKVLYSEQGKVYKLVGTAQDITLERELQLALERQVQERTEELAATNEELAATNEELEASNEEYAAINEELEEAAVQLVRSNENLQRFAYIASHDLQEPLRKVQQFGDLLKTHYGTQLGEGVGYLERMQAAAGRMSTLIKDLLDFSRISTQRDAVSSVALDEVIGSVLTDLELRIQQSGATVLVQPLPVVEGDRSQLEQLFLNLISNALKFHRSDLAPQIDICFQPVRAAELPVTVEPLWSSPTYHRIDVIDNGIGFDEKYLDRMFEVFQRLHGKNEFAGTGIGLAICEKVVANHGGAITANSQVGQGATFSVYLPV